MDRLSSFLFVLLGFPFLVNGDQYYASSTGYDAGAYGTSPLQNFTSSSLHPPAINIQTGNGSTAISSNYTLIGYRGTEVTNAAPLILDNDGSLVWSGEAQFGQTMDLIVQTYMGKPVLTLFQGAFSSLGVGSGYWAILGQDYSVITTVTSLNQTANTSDFHEFVITENNTALIESWRVTNVDLSDVEGPVDGWTWDCVFQEIDLTSNQLLFEWRSLEHVDPAESYFAVGDTGNSSDNPFDYCHINSVTKDDQGNYLMSLRGTATLYSIDSNTGEIIWRLGGKYSNFTMGPNSTFWYQHDARFLTPISSSPFNLSIFDNGDGGGPPAEPVGRGIIISVDTTAFTATLEAEYPAPFGTTVESQGSMTVMDDGNVFIGWGAEPYYSEFALNGTLLYDVHFASNSSTAQSYRAFKQAWVGKPNTNPDFAIQASAAYVSWNGATEVTNWLLLGGNSTMSLTNISSVAKTGFETQIPLAGGYAYYAAVGLASNGTCLGATEIWSASNSSSIGSFPDCLSGSGTNSTSGSGSGAESANGAAAPLIGARAALVIALCTATLLVLSSA